MREVDPILRLVLTLGCGAWVCGCGDMEAMSKSDEVDEIVSNLIQAGYPGNDIMVIDTSVYVGRDALVSLRASREMLETDTSTNQEQYRTRNLVDTFGAQRICVNGLGLSGKFDQALTDAVVNYALLDTNLRIVRADGAGCRRDHNIRVQLVSGNGGSAGFPSDGVPFDTVSLGLDLAMYGVNTIAHVITHELGHTIGMRHSDFFDRSISCGMGGNEGDAGVGAILIPGTPSGAVVGGSIMNSCFREFETGEFTATDITALQLLY